MDRQSFDQQYLERLSRSDPETCLHFTQYFTSLLLMKLRGKFRSSHQAEDATQETLLRVIKHLREKGGIDYPERLGGFVNSVCDHVVMEFFRAGSRFQQISENAPEPVSRTLDAERRCITAERKAMIKQTLSSLRNNDRLVLEKVFLEEQDKDEICRDLGIDRNYLRVQVHRALARFRLALRDSKPPKSQKASSS